MNEHRTCFWNDTSIYPHDIKTGIFLQWGLDSLEGDDGNIMWTVAIIEGSDGKVYKVLPEKITFNN